MAMVRPPARHVNDAVDYAGQTAEPAVVTGKPRVFKPIHVNSQMPAIHRVRIAKKGWETFTGEYAGQIFENAVTIDPVNEVISDRIAALIPCVDEEGNPLGFAARTLRARIEKATAHIEPLQTLASQIADRQVEDEEPIDPAQADVTAIEAANAEEQNSQRRIYSLNDLTNVADKGGINALRAIGGPLGAKGRAIPDLIGEILKAQEVLIGGDPSSILQP